MPTIYTEDPVAKAVGEHARGSMGVQTGSVANSIGYSEYQRRKNAFRGPTLPIDKSGSSGARGLSYEPFAFVQAIENAVPRWLTYSLGLLAAVLTLVIGFRQDLFPVLREAGALNWPGVVVTAGAGWLGFMAGACAIPLALRLFDLGLRLILLVVAIALGGGLMHLIVRFLDGVG